MNQAVITLIPKEAGITDPALNDLKNWRLMSLLCLDYKILTEILANRLRKILPDILSEEQNCSIPKRTIFNNLFLARDIIRYYKEKSTPFYTLQIDQKRAFVKMDQNFLFKTMETMGFSTIFINFIKILYKNNTATITNNGYFSASVHTERGLRQALFHFM